MTTPNPFVRVVDRVPLPLDFSNADGTPIVIDENVDLAYYLKKDVVTALQAPPHFNYQANVGMRKPNSDSIVLNASWSRITNYLAAVSTEVIGYEYDLVAGTLTPLFETVAQLIITIDLTFDESQSGRVFHVRLFNVTDNVATEYSIRVPVGRNTTGALVTVPALIPSKGIGKAFALEIGGGDTFTNCFTSDVQFSLISMVGVSEVAPIGTLNAFSDGFSGGFQ